MEMMELQDPAEMMEIPDQQELPVQVAGQLALQDHQEWMEPMELMEVLVLQAVPVRMVFRVLQDRPDQPEIWVTPVLQDLVEAQLARLVTMALQDPLAQQGLTELPDPPGLTARRA